MWPPGSVPVAGVKTPAAGLTTMVAQTIALVTLNAALARDVDDAETVRIAVEFAERHAERAAVLDRKIAVLTDERALLSRDVDAMRERLAEIAPAAAAPGVGDGASAASPREDRGSREFSRMEREARERAADQRLEELKRRMQKD